MNENPIMPEPCMMIRPVKVIVNKIESEDETGKQPTEGRFAPLLQIPPISFLLSISFLMILTGLNTMQGCC